MRRNPIRDLCFLALALGAAFTLGCSRPLTDIVATTSADVGAWDVANARVTGDQLAADVCMTQMDEADAISDRLLLQLRNKGYGQIHLAMYSPGDRQVRQVTWSPRGGKQMQGASPSSENPCAAWQQAGGHLPAGAADAAAREPAH